MRLIIAFGVLVLISAIKAEDLQCYVCTDCETGYENFNATCSDSGSGGESGSGSGGEGESGSGSGGESGSGSGGEGESGSGSGGEGESGSGSGGEGESGSGSGGESGSGSGGEGETGSGIGGETDSDSGPESDIDEEKIPYGNINVRVADNDENGNRRSANRFEKTDYYSVEMADKTMSQKALIRFARSTRENDAVQARCVVTSYEENNITKIKRGCSYDSGNDIQKCQRLIADDYTGTPSRCSVCDENLCNAAYKSYGSYHIQFAFIALIIGVFFNT